MFRFPKTTSQQYLSRNQAVIKMNQCGQDRVPFFFLISYDTKKTILVEKPMDREHTGIHFAFPHHKNDDPHPASNISTGLFFTPPSREFYTNQFHQVQQELQKGNIYLLNLTHATPVHSSSGLTDIYRQAQAKYKILVANQFVVFSPETFVRIRNDKIYTYPMKGTIRTAVPHALEKLRNNTKEKAEHASVVDLLRNDLGQVANTVEVTRFRYFEKVKAGQHALWQASSEIMGTLAGDFKKSLGDIIFTLLPAGSITGVPKTNAVDIIRQVENYNRGFYTGVCGYYDGQNLDSCVMIRFIEQTHHGLVYKSGGGIHQMSELEMEYQELIEKIYVPVY